MNYKKSIKEILGNNILVRVEVINLANKKFSNQRTISRILWNATESEEDVLRMSLDLIQHELIKKFKEEKLL